jgi:hypothetical protein
MMAQSFSTLKVNLEKFLKHYYTNLTLVVVVWWRNHIRRSLCRSPMCRSRNSLSQFSVFLKKIKTYLHICTFKIVVGYSFLQVVIQSGGQLLEIWLLDNHLLDTFGRKSIARHKIYQLLESGWARINWIRAVDKKSMSSSWYFFLVRHINWKSQFFTYRNG